MPTTPTGAAIPRDPTEAIIDTILRREGWPRYTDRSSDRGGPTKGGITLATLAAWRKRPVIAADVAALDEAEVRTIYRARYIEEPGFAGITDDALRALIIDSGVNHGTARAGTWLQDAVNDLAGRPVLKVDGAVGPKTLAAVNSGDAAGLWRSVFVQRMRFYGQIITGDARKRGRTEDDALNAAGWLNRLAEFMEV
ncbi:Predicted Peptidoglycan domain-containing protein [Azospirillum oryzae]|uniref:Predicted Peptidoglycan domain-containing protein n=1 Tax=Azospirillum oryzae TaxID=286727 RepID=A0A1X7HSW2_9PROT|nr:glycosyl hydrolase 108 family protein [Azospirillum oryzae]SMF92339.1 Predicted Peptidoglycan domain-containing protein [Azospirillum oryzae]